MTATPPSSGGVSVINSASDLVSGDSMMELERPGEEKKKRWEANMVAKSGGDSASESESEDRKLVSIEAVKRDLEVEVDEDMS